MWHVHVCVESLRTDFHECGGLYISLTGPRSVGPSAYVMAPMEGSPPVIELSFLVCLGRARYKARYERSALKKMTVPALLGLTF